jgi:YVTN family beta-propeller protein
VSVIDANEFREIALIEVGRRPWGIAIEPDGGRVFTANGLSNDVSIIDTRTNQVVGTVRAGRRPWGVAVTP